MLNDDQGNIAEQLDDKVILLRPLLVVTRSRTRLAKEACHTTEATNIMDINKVDDERSALVYGEEAKVLSISSYSLLNASRDVITSFTQYYNLGLRKVGDHLKVLALTSMPYGG